MAKIATLWRYVTLRRGEALSHPYLFDKLTQNKSLETNMLVNGSRYAYERLGRLSAVLAYLTENAHLSIAMHRALMSTRKCPHNNGPFSLLNKRRKNIFQ